MTYVPNADDATQPTDAILAETAQAEFRTLKTKINTMAGLSTSGQSLPSLYITVATLTATLATDIAAVEALVAGKAPLVSPAFIGTPTAPTPAPGDNSSNIATTAFIVASFATINSPVFTGTPRVPTAAVGDSSTIIANTSFVATAILNAMLTPANPAAVKIFNSATTPPGEYWVDTQLNAALTLQIQLPVSAQSIYKFVDPANCWGDSPWTLDLNGLSFYTKQAGLQAGPLVINYPDSIFALNWNPVVNALELV